MSGPAEGFKCSTCGQWHEGVILDVGHKYPDHYFGVPESERANLIWCDPPQNPDFCVIEKRDRFVRGCLAVPIKGRVEEFVFGVWTSLSETNFNRAFSLWRDEVPPNEPGYFGWLCNRLPTFENTLQLKTKVHLRNGNLRPRVELEPTNHPLSIAQREGISWEHVCRIIELTVHPE